MEGYGAAVGGAAAMAWHTAALAVAAGPEVTARWVADCAAAVGEVASALARRAPVVEEVLVELLAGPALAQSAAAVVEVACWARAVTRRAESR